MKLTTIVTTAVAALLTTTVHAAPNADPAAEELAHLSGTYSSAGSEDWGRGAFGTREFTFDKGRWTLHFVLALDPAMANKVFDFRTFGTYAIVAPSRSVPGAFEANFSEDAKYVTLRAADPKLVQAFGLAACGLVPNVETNVASKGCAGWKPVAVCPTDHDLLMLDAGGGLHFGVRPDDNDMCTPDKRPGKLLPAVVKR